MTSQEERDLRPAEASSSDAERLYGYGTPVPDRSEPSEWEPYSMRKHHHSGLQSAYGVLRNDRTPLNTPCTPAVVKLQLKRHDEEHAGDEATPTHALIATVRASVLQLLRPLRCVRTLVDRVMTRLLPSKIAQSAVFARHRGWIVWYLTTVLCIPFAMLLSPMVIALCIFTSPVWIAGGIIVVIRTLVFSSPKPPTPAVTEGYIHSTSPHHRVNGTRGVNGVSASNLRRHHHHTPASYRRTALSPHGIVEG